MLFRVMPGVVVEPIQIQNGRPLERIRWNQRNLAAEASSQVSAPPPESFHGGVVRSMPAPQGFEHTGPDLGGRHFSRHLQHQIQLGIAHAAQAIWRLASAAKRPFLAISSSYEPSSRICPPSK